MTRLRLELPFPILSEARKTEFENLVDEILNGNEDKIEKLESLVCASFNMDVSEIQHIERELGA